MPVLKFNDRKGFGVQILTDEKATKKLDFPDGITDLDCEYKGPSPYHLNYCGFEPCYPGYSFGPFIRSSYLIHVIANGEGIFHSDTGIHKAKTGQMFLIYPGETTTYTADMMNPWSYYWIGFNGYMAESILQQMGFTKEHPVVTLPDLSSAIECIEHMMQCTEASMKCELLRTSDMLRFFACTMNQEYVPQQEFIPKHGSEYAEYALRYITNNYSQNIHIAELAEKIGVVRSYLTKSFTNLYQMSPQEYLIRLRLERASYYLEHSNMAIAEISDRCGFSDLSSFCKLFKKRQGKTPTEYRKMVILNNED